MCEPLYPTEDTRLVIHTALAGLEQIYRKGYAYAKAEILLMDLRQPGDFTEDLFAGVQPAAAVRVMGRDDQINGRWGKETLRSTRIPQSADWGMRSRLLGSSYTTNATEMPIALCT